MGYPRAVIDLSPTRIAAAVVARGRVGQPAHVDIDPGAWLAAWDAGLETLDEALAEALKRAGIRNGWTAALVHSGPDALADVRSFPTQARAALRAAALVGAEGPEDASGIRVTCSRALARDKTGSPLQTHVLTAWDSAGRADVAAAWLARAGLTPTAIVPADAPLLASAVRVAMGPTGGDGALVLLIGDHGSVLAAGGAGSLRFVRRLAFGVESLVEALTRPIRARDSDAAPIALGRAAAVDILRRFGVPERETVVDPDRGLRGSDVLPLLQPALQRCAIEIKQSLRFGIPDASRAGLGLSIIGAGAGVPGLAQTLVDQTELPLRPAAGDAAPASADLFRRYLDEIASMPDVVGPRTETQRFVRRARAAVRMGAVAGAVALGAEAAHTMTGLRTARAELAVLEAAAADAPDTVATSAEVAAALARAEREIAEHHAGLASFPAWLADASRRTPQNIRVVSLNGRYDGGRPIVELEGATLVGQASEGEHGVGVKGYIDGLAACPLVEGVQLMSVQRATGDSSEGQRFTLLIALRPAPPAYVRGVMPAANSEDDE